MTQATNELVDIEKRLDFSGAVGTIIGGNLGRGEGGKFVNIEDLRVQTANEMLARMLAANERKRKKKEAERERKRQERERKKAERSEKRRQEKERKRKEKEAKQAAAREKVMVALQEQGGVSGEALRALVDFRGGGTLSPEMANELAEVGLVEIDGEGKPRMSSKGVGMLRAANRGDVRLTLDRLSQAKEAAAVQLRELEIKAEEARQLDNRTEALRLDAQAERLRETIARRERERLDLAVQLRKTAKFQPPKGAQKDEVEKGGGYGYTCLDMPPDVAAIAGQMAANIDAADLTEDGIETFSHVTVLYGLMPSVAPGEIAHFAYLFEPVTVTFGDISLFENDEFDVVKLSVEGEDLRRLERMLRYLPNENKWPEYNLHMTLAYVRPGQGKRYLAMDNPLKGRTVTIDHLRYETAAGETMFLPLGGLAKQGPLDEAEQPIADYEAELTALIEQATANEISQDEFESRVNELAATMIMAMFLLGSQYNEGDLPPEAVAAVQDEIATHRQSAATLAADVANGDYDEGRRSIAAKVALWTAGALGVLALGQLFKRNDPEYRWDLGAAEHSPDCLNLAGRVRRASEWRADNLYPRSQKLDCFLGCKCRFAEV